MGVGWVWHGCGMGVAFGELDAVRLELIRHMGKPQQALYLSFKWLARSSSSSLTWAFLAWAARARISAFSSSTTCRANISHCSTAITIGRLQPMVSDGISCSHQAQYQQPAAPQLNASIKLGQAQYQQPAAPQLNASIKLGQAQYQQPAAPQLNAA